MPSDTHTPSRQGRLFIVSAPSGAGKTTLCRALLAHFTDLKYAVSHTTRAPRPGEVHGADYFFVTPAVFEAMIAADQLAEWARVHDHYYGTSTDTLNQALMAGQDLLLDIDIQGAEQLLVHYPDSVTIFIRPPSLEALKARLETRSANTPADLARRLANAQHEMERESFYRHVIINDDLSTATAEIIQLIGSYRTAPPST